MGSTINTTPERNATDKELQQYEVAKERILQLDTSNTFNVSDPNHRLFFVSFDGTRNDRETSDLGNVETNPALLEKMIPDVNNVEAAYIPGVATRNDNTVDHYHEAITGDGCERKAEEAYDQLKTQVQQSAEGSNLYS